MKKVLTALKWIFICPIGFLFVYVFNFFVNLVFFPNMWPQESWEAAKPTMFKALFLVIVSAVGLLIVFKLEKRLSGAIKGNLVIKRCEYCKREFEDQDEIWFNEDLGAICKPDQNDNCGAIHSDPYRTRDWKPIILL